MSDEDQYFQNDKNLKCLRIELNSNHSVFLYYKVYPKQDSTRFPQTKSAIFFFFDSEHVDKHFIKTYISQIGPIDEIEIGNYVNRKGSKKKRKTVFFAIVKFIEEDSLTDLLNQYETQKKINLYIENRRNRNINLKYNPMDDQEEQDDEEIDEEGFIKVTSNRIIY